MREKMLANQSQNIYAGNSDKTMTSVDLLETMPLEQLEQIVEQARKEAEAAAQKVAAEMAEQKIRQELAEQEKEKEEKERQKGKQEEQDEVSAKKGQEKNREEDRGKTQKEKNIFSKLPGGSRIRQAANSFLIKLAGSEEGLQGLSTETLIKSHNELRSLAEEQGEKDLSFLSELETELEIRGVSAEGVYRAYKNAYVQRLNEEYEKAEQTSVSLNARQKQIEIARILAKNGDTKKLQDLWDEAFKGETDPDTLSTIKMAVEMGLAPTTVTSKGRTEIKAREVIRHALIKDDKEAFEKALKSGDKEELRQALEKNRERLEAAKKILGISKLSEEQQIAILEAHFIGSGKAGVYGYAREQLRDKAEILGRKSQVTGKDLFDPKQRRTLMEAGIAAEPTYDNLPRVGNPTLDAIVDQINNVPVTDRRDIGRIDRLLERVERNVDEGRVPTNLAREIINGLEGWRVQARGQGEEAGRRRRGEGEEMALSLKPEDAERINLDQFPDVRDAEEIRSAIERGEVDNDYLKRKITELRQQQDALDQEEAREINPEAIIRIGKARDQAAKLRGQAQELKDLIGQREGEERLKSSTSWQYSNYGELRMAPKQIRELIETALTGKMDKNGEIEELEKHFNLLFTTADTRSSEDWREAQGTRGQIEVDDFTTALDRASSGRMTWDYKPLTPEQKDRLNQISRRLSQEVNVRRIMHDVTYYTNEGFGLEDLSKLIKNFSGEDIDFAYRINGVSQVAHYFEQAMLEVMAKNGGWIPAATMVNENDGTPGEVERLVRDQIEIAKNLGSLKLEDWEIGRAISIGRGINIATLRTIEIIASHGIPPVPEGSMLNSWWANSIVSKLAFFRQIGRYDSGKQRARLLAMRIENRGKVWRTKELEEIKALNIAENINRFVNESTDDRLVNQVNPGQVGSIYFQTGWRYAEDSEYFASSIAHLLDGNPFNPLLGVGMWLEKQRRKMNSTGEISDRDKNEALRLFGVNVEKEGELAKLIIDKNLDLAAQITPLKLFYNMVGLRQQILRSHYSNSIDERGGPSSGKIFITDEVLQGDLKTLAAMQEGLIRKRIDVYKEYLERKKADPNAAPPNLYTEYTDLYAEIRDLVAREKLTQEQAGRIQTFIDHVRNEFYKPNQKDRLIGALKDKGWKIPFIFGTDDIPYDLYEFAKTGRNTLERRWGDNSSVAAAGELFKKKLINRLADFREQEGGQDKLIETLIEIHDTMAGHDEGRTREFMLLISEAVIKFYKKDILARLPAGLGMLNGLIGGKTSYAQIAFGRDAMAWDEIEIDTFIKKIKGAGLINPEDVKKLRDRTGAQMWSLGLAITRTAVPLGFLALFYYLFSQGMKDIIKTQ